MKAALPIVSAMVPLIATCAASAQFSVQYLGNFGPAVTYRMNASGQVAGDAQISALTTAIRYTPGVGMQARTTPAGAGMSYAVGINNAGACIGQVDPGPSQVEVAAIWDASNVLTMLPIPSGTWTYNTGTDINDANITCGFVTLALVGPDQQQGWRWDSVNGYSMLPQLSGGNYAFARDINASGTICGYAGADEDSPMHAVIWDAANQLTDLGLVGTASATYAQAINNAGVVVGTTDNGQAWRYTPGTGMVVLPKLAGSAFSTRTYAMGVNNSGWVVGYAWQAGEPHTVVWGPDNTLYKIDDYAGGDFYFPADESYPIAIGDNNDLVVYAYDFAHAGDPLAVRFHFGIPVPCAADVNGDHTVNVADLLSVISSWGACAVPANCPADVNHDASVNVADLLAVISAWGACP